MTEQKLEEKIFPSVLINNKLYYTIDDAAKCLNISEHTLRREIDRKNITYMPHSKGMMFLPEWLTEWCERKTIHPRKKIQR